MATTAAFFEPGMQFRIADTFTDSLAKLTGDEQKAVKTAAFDLQMNPAHPGLDGGHAARPRRRGPGHRRRGAAVSGGPGREPADLLVLRRRSRATDLPDAVLLAGSASTCAGDPIRCESTTARRIRSGDRRTGFCRPSWPTSTATRSDGLGVQRAPHPRRTFDAPEDETKAIADWLRARQRAGYVPHAIGVFVRSRSSGRCRRCGRPVCDPYRWTTGPAACPGRSRSAPCTSPRGWSSGRSRWPPATTR